jgi:hypothetical protein
VIASLAGNAVHVSLKHLDGTIAGPELCDMLTHFHVVGMEFLS